jgi:hypothetical protein
VEGLVDVGRGGLEGLGGVDHVPDMDIKPGPHPDAPTTQLQKIRKPMSMVCFSKRGRLGNRN